MFPNDLFCPHLVLQYREKALGKFVASDASSEASNADSAPATGSSADDTHGAANARADGKPDGSSAGGESGTSRTSVDARDATKTMPNVPDSKPMEAVSDAQRSN